MAEINIDTFNSDEWHSLDEKIKQLQENTEGNQSSYSQENFRKSKELISRYQDLLIYKEAYQYNQNIEDWAKIIQDGADAMTDTLNVK